MKSNTQRASERAFSRVLQPASVLKSTLLSLGVLVGASAGFAQSLYLQDTAYSLVTWTSTPGGSPFTTFTVGSTTVQNSLTISGSGTDVDATGTVNIGLGTGSSGNSVTVTSGATLDLTTGSGTFVTIGDQGADNTFTISGGATVNTYTMTRIGFRSNDNIFIVTGTDSLLQIHGAPASAHLCIAGNSGADNWVIVEEGGTIIAPAVRVGGMAGVTTATNDNTLLVTGVGSSVYVEDLYIAVNSGGTLQPISGNSLVVDGYAIVAVDGNIQINNYGVPPALPQNFIRLGKNGVILWKGDKVAAFNAFITGSYVQYDNLGTWTTDTNTANYSVGYNSLLGYTIIAYTY